MYTGLQHSGDSQLLRPGMAATSWGDSQGQASQAHLGEGQLLSAAPSGGS